MNSYSIFVKGLEKHIHKTFDSLLKQSEAEEHAVISKHLKLVSESFAHPDKAGSEIKLSVPRIFKKSDIIKYSILSWYCTTWTRFELQEFLRKKCTQLRLFEIETLYLYSKELMLYTLFRENDCTHGNLFGNILQPGIYINNYYQDFEGIKKIRLKKSDFIKLVLSTRTKPKKKVFRRGYNDKGSLPPFDKRARIEANTESLTFYEKELERNREQLLAKNKQLQFLLEMNEGIGS